MTMSSHSAADARSTSVPTLAFIGGFLGAGKTTSIIQLTKLLQANGRKVGIVTNDQSDGLVDSQLAHRYASTSQVPGGCFCCKSDELVRVLRAQSKAEPLDVILAEPVGSCTDLMATLIRPLKQLYRIPMRIAPLITIIDSRRAAAHFLGGRFAAFAKEVNYVWEKQLEEAEVLVLNKSDLLTSKQTDRLHEKLRSAYPDVTIIVAIARDSFAMDKVLDHILDRSTGAEKNISVDYTIYARGEALLGWVNLEASLESSGSHKFSASYLVTELGQKIHDALKTAAQIAHMKLSIEASDKRAIIAVANAASNDETVTLSAADDSEISACRLLINIRAEGDPDVIVEIAKSQVAAITKSIRATWHRVEAFRPSEPRPKHHI